MTPIIFLFFVVQIVHSASDSFPKGQTPTILDSKIHCKFDRNFSVTLASISICCEIELSCLKYDEDGKIATPGLDDAITLANIAKINAWRAANKTQAVIICSQTRNIYGTVLYWENSEDFRLAMRNTTIPFLVRNKIQYMLFHWDEVPITTDDEKRETKRTIDLLDEACGNKCDVLYAKNFQKNVTSQQCLVQKLHQDKLKILDRKLTDCDYIYNPRAVIYDDGYKDTFDISEPTINMKKVVSCRANFTTTTSEKVHCEFRKVLNLTLASIQNCCEVVIRCLQYDANGNTALPQPDPKTTLANIKRMNDWRAANKTTAVVICAPALDRNGFVPNIYTDESKGPVFGKGRWNATKPFLDEHKIVNLEFFIAEFGLKSENEADNMIKKIQEMREYAGNGFNFFFDNTYEMAGNASKCLVQALEKQRIAEAEMDFRRRCDEYLLNAVYLQTYLEEAKFFKFEDKKSLKTDNNTDFVKNCTAAGPSENYFELQLAYLGYNLEQCEDLDYGRVVGYKDKTIGYSEKGEAVDLDAVFGCWLAIGHWEPDTSGKGKWFSPYP